MSVPAGFVPLTASNIQDVSGAKLAAGTLQVQPTDNNDNPIVADAGGSGQPGIMTALKPASFTITNGALPSTAQIADTTQTNPVNISYRMTVTDSTGTPLIVLVGVQTQNNTPLDLDTLAQAGNLPVLYSAGLASFQGRTASAAVLTAADVDSVGTISNNTTGNAATATTAAEIGGVSVSGSPSAGEVLTATSSTAASWQTPSGGSSGTPTVAAGAGVGTGGQVQIMGTDQNHRVTVTLGSSLQPGILFTVTFSTARSRNTYPIVQPEDYSLYSSLSQIPSTVQPAAEGGPASTEASYVVNTNAVALTPNTTLVFNCSCP